jgi:hypothetical protein
MKSAWIGRTMVAPRSATSLRVDTRAEVIFMPPPHPPVYGFYNSPYKTNRRTREGEGGAGAGAEGGGGRRRENGFTPHGHLRRLSRRWLERSKAKSVPSFRMSAAWTRAAPSFRAVISGPYRDSPYERERGRA